jgi:uncharacterized membrane protein
MGDELMTDWPSPSAPIPTTLPDGDGTGLATDRLGPVRADAAMPSVLDRAQALVRRVATEDRLDAVVDRLQDLLDRVPSDVRSALQGRALGHPLHPALTDLPIGFWTSAGVLDLVGGKRAARGATALVGLGVASALPTLAAGMADWTEMSRAKQRVGVVHAAANAAATVLYAKSFGARRMGQRGRGIWLGLLGAGVATAGGYLGGHLAFGDDDTEERDG